MQEPWNLKITDDRPADSLPNFIIFCEDGEVEPEYFKALSTEKIKITTIINCGKQHQQVDYAKDYCRNNSLLENIEGVEQLKFDEGTQVWCVFDRDKEPNDRKDSSFDNSIIVAKAIGIKTAWSNDDFELWILLHFEEVPAGDQTYSHRSKYYERLTAILKAFPSKNELEQKVIGNSMFTYKGTMKSKKRFLGITLQRMKGNTETAIARATQLESHHSSPPKPNHQKFPCTLVHHLVTEIIRLGGKSI